MKFTNVLFFAMLITAKAFSQSDSIALLSCKTWGAPDWTRLEHFYEISHIKRTGSTIREFDSNIEGISPSLAEAYADDVFLRWILKDTTIFYDIKVSNGSGELVYTTSSNKCGIYIPFGVLRQQYSISKLEIEVERTKKSGYNWGISFVVDETRPSNRKQIKTELNEILTKASPEQSAMIMVDYFIKNNRDADALYTLDLAKQNDPENLEITKKYWVTVNDMFIRKMR
jgi:hypothetical protein